MFRHESKPEVSRSRSRLYRLGALIVGTVGTIYSAYGMAVTERATPNSTIATTFMGLSLLAVVIPVELMVQDKNQEDALIQETEEYLKGIGEEDKWVRDIYLHLADQPRMAEPEN